MLSASPPQSMVTNGPEPLGPLKWSARATTSLPVPLSPAISTVLLFDAIRAISLNTPSMRGLTPTTLPG